MAKATEQTQQVNDVKLFNRWSFENIQMNDCDSFSHITSILKTLAVIVPVKKKEAVDEALSKGGRAVAPKGEGKLALCKQGRRAMAVSRIFVGVVAAIAALLFTIEISSSEESIEVARTVSLTGIPTGSLTGIPTGQGRLWSTVSLTGIPSGSLTGIPTGQGRLWSIDGRATYDIKHDVLSCDQ
ncbi:hypothetical protein SAY87_023850 [Trapa incisa]|uniref:Uncharacterized protein n=1 Tax=Trapa incisa TaxID=236973 RepID=A0AAN7L1X1_9MYRT|nr:hypothetical protein SAY87_023850 [Trapa incisa]